jgi:hypothetical protein
MKAKFGAIVVDGRGKIGGHVASKNKAGAFFRTKVTPINNDTTYQNLVRTIFGSVSQAWASLTFAQRKEWNSAVSKWTRTDVFGDIRVPSGKQLHQRLSTQAQIAGYSAIATVPDVAQMPSNILTAVTLNIGASSSLVTSRYTGSDARFMIFASPPLSPGIMAPKGKLFLIYKAQCDAFGSSANYTSYVNKYGTPTAGDNVFFGIKYVKASGQSTVMQIVKATINA